MAQTRSFEQFPLPLPLSLLFYTCTTVLMHTIHAPLELCRLSSSRRAICTLPWKVPRPRCLSKISFRKRQPLLRLKIHALSLNIDSRPQVWPQPVQTAASQPSFMRKQSIQTCWHWIVLTFYINYLNSLFMWVIIICIMDILIGAASIRCLMLACLYQGQIMFLLLFLFFPACKCDGQSSCHWLIAYIKLICCPSHANANLGVFFRVF